MRKWLLILILVMMLAFPSNAFAQIGLSLSTVRVQLWPEYDQPSMLVLVDYSAAANTKLPAKVSFRLPKEANLVAVASYSTDGTLVNANFDEPVVEGDWQTFTVTLGSSQGRLEYYQPITFNGDQRTFSYIWESPYAVDAFDVSVMEPVDTTSLTTEPKLPSISQEGGLKYYGNDPVKLAQNEKFSLSLNYKKSSKTLVSSSSPVVEPTAPLDDNTTGRVSLNNSLPYIIGGFGFLLIVGGLLYYLKAGKTDNKKPRRRMRVKSDDEEGESDVYCSQCGTRARGADRFCRVCGSRIKQHDD